MLTTSQPGKQGGQAALVPQQVEIGDDMAQIDLVVRGGTVADGSGGPLTQADIAIKDGTILAVGPEVAKHLPEAAETIDARGLLVTPGFVDIHTHYDGQVTWAD